MLTQYNLKMPHAVYGGENAMDNITAIIKARGAKKVAMFTDKGIEGAGLFALPENAVKAAGAEYYVLDDLPPEPSYMAVQKLVDQFKASGADLIVACGGGSVMDAAKAIAVVASNGGDYWDYIPCGTGKGKAVAETPLPIVAITTTAGTGSETDAGCVITNAETHEKTGFVHPGLFPVLAVIDPELMLTVPPKFTAFQGFDALFHSTEAYISNAANLMSDMYVLNAIENVARYLPRAVADGSDLEARTRVAWGNTLSGSVMCVGRCTSEHSLEHAMSAYHQELPHGAGLIMISKAYYAHFIERHVCDERFVAMARALGVEDAREPMDFIRALEALQRACGVADLRMSDYGISPDEFPAMVRNARETMGFLFPFDREPLSDEECEAIYRASYR